MRNSRGFSLLEMIIVIALIVLITFLALPTISSYFEVSLNSAAREMATTIKETYNSSVLTGNVHRLAFDFKNRQYWVEVGPPTVLLDTAESKQREEEQKKFAKPSDKPPPSPFSLDPTVTHKKVNLPRGVKFEDVISEQSNDPIEDGMAYSHFFPSGLAEQTIVHLEDTSNHHFTLFITPLLGRTDLYERYATKEEILGKK